MKSNMSIPIKILLSPPSFLKLGYGLTFAWPVTFAFLYPTSLAYNLQIGFVHALTIIQISVLIYKLWSFKNVEKEIKKEWTWILIICASISSLYFLWKRMDELEELNNFKSSNEDCLPKI